MKINKKAPMAIAAAIITVVVAVWWALSIDCYWKSGDYRLAAVDGLENMSLMFGSDSGEALIGPVIFAVGENKQFIVLKQHPPVFQNQGNDRTITNYFVVTRALDRDAATRAENIRGPLTKAQFDKLSKELALPPFSKTFKDLE